MAATTKDRITLRPDDASPKVRASATQFIAARSLCLAIKSSMNFATKIVHVTNDAKTNPAMIAFTMRLAEIYIDQGDNSCSPTATDLAEVLAEKPESRTRRQQVVSLDIESDLHPLAHLIAEHSPPRRNKTRRTLTRSPV
jgi:hypothetical protein